ncbi:GPI transamidase component PIG-S isoform X2 [Nematostella vectensis]|uniref:GPI transamidase component PIG-S isoform X2 n=1 Tax=Nematostella vectensis TaxID=45351 RepID=UPI0020770ABF|nr:GPI transamidase component PIG-S isoform X2 [Nematostella vectensis]
MAKEKIQTSPQRKATEKWTQAVVSLSVGFVFLFVGLPLWWNTTKVYRAVLPYGDIEELAAIKLRYEVYVKVLLSDGYPSSLAESLVKDLNHVNSRQVTPSYRVSVISMSPEEEALLSQGNKNLLSIQELDKAFNELWNKRENRPKESIYTFIVLPQDMSINWNSSYVGKAFSAILPQKDIANIKDIVKSVYVNEKSVQDAFMASSLRTPEKTAESMRAQKSVTGYQISFTLLNCDPESWIPEWDIQGAIDSYLQPFLMHFHHLDISVDSQILHYGEVGVTPRQDDKNGHFFHQEDLPHIINPVEAKLGSFVSLHPNLNFIVFVPSKKHTPLHLRSKDGSSVPSNAFLSPQWGGIVVYNMDDVPSNTSLPLRMALDTRRILTVFITQLKLLLGAEPVGSPQNTLVDVSSTDLTDWEKTALFRRKTMEYLATATTTLTSLAHLLEQIGNMVIGDQIKNQVEQALAAIHKSKEELALGNVTSAFLEAKSAIVSSEKAFFDPSILALLYFPDDQKYAIYIPLFLPISLPVLMSLIKGSSWIMKLWRGEGSTKGEQAESSEEPTSTSH